MRGPGENSWGGRRPGPRAAASEVVQAPARLGGAFLGDAARGVSLGGTSWEESRSVSQNSNCQGARSGHASCSLESVLRMAVAVSMTVAVSVAVTVAMTISIAMTVSVAMTISIAMTVPLRASPVAVMRSVVPRAVVPGSVRTGRVIVRRRVARVRVTGVVMPVHPVRRVVVQRTMFAVGRPVMDVPADERVTVREPEYSHRRLDDDLTAHVSACLSRARQGQGRKRQSHQSCHASLSHLEPPLRPTVSTACFARAMP